LEAIFVEIVTPTKKKIIIGSVYKSPRCPPMTFTEQFAQFIDIFSNTLNSLGSICNNVYICGDFNLDVLKIDGNHFIADYIDTLFSYGFLQIITKPTRICRDSATIIDHIITNSSRQSFETFILCTKISDHFPILHILDYSKPSKNTKKFESRNFSDVNISEFKRTIENLSWNQVLNCNNTQEAYNQFSDTFLTLYDLHFPVTTKTFNKNFHKLEPWMTAGILISRKTKNALCSTSLHFPTIASKNAFKTFRSIYNTVIRNAKKAYFANELETNKSNLKKTWATLNRAINKPISKSSSCTSLLIDGSLTDDPALMTEHFNTFFATAAKKITDELHPTSKSPTAHIPTNQNKFSLNNSPVTDSEILGVTKLLLDKTSLDFNGISMAFIKKIIDVIVRPLRHIFTLSFASGCVPLQFKIAKVIPVFKSGDNSIMDNYRPISLLSNFSKILEKIVSSRLLFFLDTNNILTK
jgi:hypothetical protein